MIVKVLALHARISVKAKDLSSFKAIEGYAAVRAINDTSVNPLTSYSISL